MSEYIEGKVQMQGIGVWEKKLLFRLVKSNKKNLSD